MYHKVLGRSRQLLLNNFLFKKVVTEKWRSGKVVEVVEEKNSENISSLMSLPVDRLNSDLLQRQHSCQNAKLLKGKVAKQNNRKQDIGINYSVLKRLCLCKDL